MGEVHVLRHGESTANVEGVIVSLPGARALQEVGLTPRGRSQVHECAEEARAAGFDASTIVVTSDFARARETAEVFAAGLGAGAPRVDERLRERGFGVHDEGPTTAYEAVWALDAARAEQSGSVEPVESVAARVGEALRAADELAADGYGHRVVLVAHGDVLQIALALGAGRDPHEHRDQPHLVNAELRRLGPARPSVGGVA